MVVSIAPHVMGSGQPPAGSSAQRWPDRTRNLRDGQLVTVLQLLTQGMTRTSVARCLGVSPRTIDEYISIIKQLTMGNRAYDTGALVVRRRYVSPERLLARAVRRRVGREWVEPTARQREILAAMVRGMSDHAAAARTGYSVRTVRRGLADLLHANLVSGRWAGGAVFEALGWHGSPAVPQDDGNCSQPYRLALSPPGSSG